MMHPTTMQALGQARLAELRDQAQRDALARAAHRARQHERMPGPLAAPTRRAHRTAPAPENWWRRARPAR
jgi:hypothetical protein